MWKCDVVPADVGPVLGDGSLTLSLRFEVKFFSLCPSSFVWVSWSYELW